jgi:hypothetical protein
VNGDPLFGMLAIVPRADFDARLSAIDWSRLKHAYGSAAEVPAKIRQLISPDEDERSDAQNEFLYASLWHQGTVYEATGPAVPFLVELLEDPSVPNREPIAIALGLMAQGTSYHEVHADYVGSKPKLIARERQWVRAARSAIRDGVPVYLALLPNVKPPLRAALLFVLVHFPEDAAAIERHLGKARIDRLVRKALTAHPHADGEAPCDKCQERWAEILDEEVDPLLG